MATNLEAIILAAYTAVENVATTIEPDVPFLRWRLRETPLDKAPLPDRIRAFSVFLGPGTKDETWSTRTKRWYKGELRVQVGYANEVALNADPNALGYEGMADADLPLITNKILFSAFAAINDMKSPEYLRSDPSLGTSRLHVFMIEWAEVV